MFHRGSGGIRKVMWLLNCPDGASPWAPPGLGFWGIQAETSPSMITTPLCRAPLFVSSYGWICIYLHFVLSDNMHRIQMEMTCIDLYINEAVNGCHPWPSPLAKACVVQKVTHLRGHQHCRAPLGTPGARRLDALCGGDRDLPTPPAPGH